MRRPLPSLLTLVSLAVVLFGAAGAAAQDIPTPEEHFGFRMGAERRLPDWRQLAAYYGRLARTSDRVSLDTIGLSTGGRPLVMLTITSPANHRRLEMLRDVQQRLADPRRISGAAERERLLEQGRAVVLLTHGIHSDEVGSVLAAARLAWRLAASDEPEVRKIVEETIVLQIPSLNPDGTQWIAEWHAAHRGTPWEGAPLPWLYHRYVGHDANRDWYAFTQRETEVVVREAYHRWHPQIVHDLHQMDGDGARIFFPPWLEPIEPNVDPALLTASTHLGTLMAARLTADEKSGAVVQAIYDAWSPSRAYAHYHGGVRLLSETASADGAAPVVVEAGTLWGGRGYDASRASWNYPLPWEGGSWSLADVVDYMEAGAMALLHDAAVHRRYWLENSLSVAERAVAGWESWPAAWIVPATPSNRENPVGLNYLLRVLALGEVEVHRAEAPFRVGQENFPAGSYVVPMRQPYAAFAQALLATGTYPAPEHPGDPSARPYDVTSHALPLLLGVAVVPVETRVRATLSAPLAPRPLELRTPVRLTGPRAPRVALYKGWQESMEAGWTRWLFDQYGVRHDTLHDADLRRGGLEGRYDVIVLQSQSPRSILEGWSEEDVPARWAGGIGEQGRRALRSFVRGGGRLVAIEEATELATEVLDLGVGSAVDRLPEGDFFAPGALVTLDLAESPLTGGSSRTTHAWFGPSSRAFTVTDPTVRVLARYGPDRPLADGWMLGERHIAGRPALVQAEVGRGSVVLFGFQPNYRGQSAATWPLLLRALTVPRGGSPSTDRSGGDT